MTIGPLLALHIGAAGLSLATGAVAMAVHKGGARHLSFGTVFCAAILVMSASAIILAAAASQGVNLLAGAVTFYMVASGWLAVRRPRGAIGPLDYGATLVGAAASAGGLIAAAGAAHQELAVPYAVFGAIAALGLAGDVAMYARGGTQGPRRLLRHLWRVGFGFLITVVSFFAGKAHLLPAFVRAADLQFLPIVWVLGMMIVWTARLSFGRRAPRRIAGLEGTRARRA